MVENEIRQKLSARKVDTPRVNKNVGANNSQQTATENTEKMAVFSHMQIILNLVCKHIQARMLKFIKTGLCVKIILSV